MKTLAEKLKQLPKARRRKITARANALIAEDRPRLPPSPLSASIQALIAQAWLRPTLLTLGEAAAILNISPGALRRRMAQRKLADLGGQFPIATTPRRRRGKKVRHAS